ncbi:MAG: T9SS type A sorting domain-containing protein, partial [Bacteroidota bacterium]
ADTSTSVGPPIGIEEEVAMGIEKIYFANEQLNIQLNGQLQGATDFVVVSTSGQVVKSETANLSGVATNRIIDMSDVANGVYIINIATGDLTTSKRFVKQ